MTARRASCGDGLASTMSLTSRPPRSHWLHRVLWSHPLLFIHMEAAFPSVSHRFLFKCLRRLGGDHPVVRIIINIYSEASTSLPVSGEEFLGFPCGAGVRQGCPVSGSLFVVVLHTFMVEIDTQLALAIIKCTFRLRLFAFADDLPMATDNLWALLKFLAGVLPRFEVAINLKVKPRRSRPPCGTAPTSTTQSGASRPSFHHGARCKSC
jgi:hypothetical protein